MIEINLIPNVKQEFLNAQRARSTVIMLSVLVCAIALMTVGLLASYVYGVQGLRGMSADKTIDEQYGKLTNDGDENRMEEIDKMLTLQNQLSKISSLNSDKKITSRIFDLLTAIIPPEPNIVKFSSVTIDSADNTIKLEGQAARGFAAVEVFKKTLASASVKYTDSNKKTQTIAIASEISHTTSYGSDSSGDKVLRFSLSFKYAKELFAPSSKGTKMIITTNGNVTDSYLGIPKDIFTEAARDLEEGN